MAGTPYRQLQTPARYEGRLTRRCPECEDPDLRIRGTGKGAKIVRCETCGHEIDPVRHPLRAEAMTRAVRRWNLQFVSKPHERDG